MAKEDEVHQPSSEKEIRQLEGSQAAIVEALANHARDILSMRNVIDVGVGFHFRKGRMTDHIGPIVLVSRKVSSDRLRKKDRIPRSIKLYGKRMRIDVIQMSKPKPAACVSGIPATQHKIFPNVPGGVAIAGLDQNDRQVVGRRGSTGVIVKRQGGGASAPKYMLTCKHIVDQGNNTSQPWVDVSRGGWVASHPALDASIIELDSIAVQIECFGRYRRIMPPIIGAFVKKSGAATGRTHSKIIGRTVTDVFIDNRPRIPAGGAGMVYNYISDGDSGSVSISDGTAANNKRVIGLNRATAIWGGGIASAPGVILPPVGTPVGIAIQIKPVLRGLGLSLVT